MTRRATFTQADLTKLLKAAAGAGVALSRLEIAPDGRIIAQIARPGQDEGDDGHEWDRRINASPEARPAGKRY